MKILIKSITGGFGRVFGRFLFYIFIGYVIYLLINKLGINIQDYIPSIGRFIL